MEVAAVIELLMSGNKKRTGAPFLYATTRVSAVESYLIKLDSGLNEEWRVLVPYDVQSAPCYANGFVFLCGRKSDGGGYVEKRNSSDGSLVWSYSSELATATAARFVVRASSSNVFFGFSTSSFAGRLHCINSANGLRFKTETYSTNIDPTAIFALPDDGALIGLFGGNLRRLNSSGNLVWQFNTSESGLGLVTYDPDTSRVYINGNKNYDFSTGGDAQTTALSIRNPTSSDPGFFYSNNDGFLSKSTKNTLTQQWISQSQLTSSGDEVFHVAEDGYIYFGSNTSLYCISPAGDIIEQSSLGGNGFGGISVEPGPYGSGFWN